MGIENKYFRIEIKCCHCGTNNSLLFDTSQSSLNCSNCNKTIFTAKRIRGFIYILHNKSMPGLLKIGYSEREVKSRVIELNSKTALPEDFEILAFFESYAPKEEETKIHKILNDKRINIKREFFELEQFDAIKKIIEILGRNPNYLQKNIIEHFYDAQEKIQNTSKKKDPIKESEFNILPNLERSLFIACKWGKIESVKNYLNKNPYLNKKDKKGRTIFDVAEEYNQKEILKILMEYKKNKVNIKYSTE